MKKPEPIALLPQPSTEGHIIFSQLLSNASNAVISSSSTKIRVLLMYMGIMQISHIQQCQTHHTNSLKILKEAQMHFDDGNQAELKACFTDKQFSLPFGYTHLPLSITVNQVPHLLKNQFSQKRNCWLGCYCNASCIIAGIRVCWLPTHTLHSPLERS